ncbi:MAG TPA: glycosyltransferase family 39 protein, partial [Saprospiraceae bacterium]|nr:glycosyltransferase family 39 protein [Saprospiraceae bacterium]
KSKKKTTASQLFAGLKVEQLGLYFSLLGTLLYLQTITFDFTQDDAIVITENMFTTQGIKGIPGIFGNDTFYGYFKDRSKLNLVSGGRYRPLTPAMFAVEYALAAGKPWFSHLINAICYGLLCWMIYGFAQALFNQRMGSSQAIQAAALTAVIFAVHPIHTEAVANIKGRDEIVAAMGAVLGLWLMIRSLNEDKSTALLFGAAISFFAGLLAKENVITILAVAPVTLWWYNKKPGARWMRSLWPIMAASVLFLIIRFSVTGLSVGKPPIELMNNPFLKVVDKTYVPFSIGEKTSTIMYTMGKYAQLLVFPYPLTHDYYPRHIEIQNWGKPLVLLSLLFWLGLLWLVLQGWKSRTWLAYGIIFYCCTMSITSNIVFPIGTNMSERFAFLPSVGFALITGVGASNWLNRSNGLSVKSIIIAVLVVLAGWTLVRSRVWISNHVLFSTDVHTSKHSAKLLNAAGGDLVTMAYSEKDPQKKKEELAQA